jgi:hypothetical protein
MPMTRRLRDRIQKQSMMPEGLVSNLTSEDLADLIAYLQSLTGKENTPTKKDAGKGQRNSP